MAGECETALEIPEEHLQQALEEGKMFLNNLQAQYDEEFTKLLEENAMLRKRVAELESR